MPDWKNAVRLRLAPLHLTAVAESQLADEIAQHLEDRYHDLTAAGAPPHDAYTQVLRELEDIEPLRAGLYSEDRLPRYDAVPAGDARPGNFLDGLWRDFRYAFRSMR